MNNERRARIHAQARRAVGIKSANEVHEEHLSPNERLGLAITRVMGTMWTAYIFLALSLISLPAALASGSALVIVAWIAQTCLQLVLLPVIIVGQNLASRHSEIRAEMDHERAVRIESMLAQLMPATKE